MLAIPPILNVRIASVGEDVPRKQSMLEPVGQVGLPDPEHEEIVRSRLSTSDLGP